MECLFEVLQNKFIENIDQENKQNFIIDLLNSDLSNFVIFLPDDMLHEFTLLPDSSLQKFIKICEPYVDQGKSNMFIGKVLNLLCDKFVQENDTIKFKLDTILNNNLKYMALDVCKKYLTIYDINIAHIASSYGYIGIYNEYMNDDNASIQIKKIFAKFEKDQTMTHIISFFKVLNSEMFRHVIKHVTNLVTDRYNLHGVLTSQYLTLEDVQLITKKQSNKISKKVFESQVPRDIIKNLNNIFVDWLIDGDKIKFSEQNLGYLIEISSDASHKNLVIKLLKSMAVEMFDTTNIVYIKQIICNVIQHMDTKQLFEFDASLLGNLEILEIYKQHVPPLMYITKLNSSNATELCEAITNTKLNEKHHKHTFDYIFLPTIVERYLDEIELQTCLKNVTVPLRKIIVEQITNQYKKLTKQTLLKFNNIYPIIVKKIYAKFLSARLSQLIVAKIDMNTITLSNEEILDMCLIKEEYECGICYLNQITIACKTCGHGICKSCETGIKKDDCSFCRETYNYVTLRS